MDNKDKEIIKKLLKIATNQQKIIEKLAQDPFAGLTPEQLSNMPAEKLQEQVFGPSKSTTAPAGSAKPGQMQVGPTSSLPSDIVAALDKANPKLKGALNLSVNGKTVNVRYNKVKLPYWGADVKKVLQTALPGYSVADPIGQTPDADWHPNY